MAEDVNLVLTRVEALVLFEWCARMSADDYRAAPPDRAERRALWDLEVVLDSALPEVLAPDHGAGVAAAREALSR